VSVAACIGLMMLIIGMFILKRYITVGFLVVCTERAAAVTGNHRNTYQLFLVAHALQCCARHYLQNSRPILLYLEDTT